MKKRMIYLGMQKSCWFKSKRRPLWLAYDHKSKCAFLFTSDDHNDYFWIIESGILRFDGVRDIITEKDGLSLKQLHEKYYYPTDLEGETVKLELNKEVE